MSHIGLKMGFAGRLNRVRGAVLGPARGCPGRISVKRDGEDRTTVWAPWFWMRESDGKLGRTV
jgi:hypothetical protein